MVRKQVLIIIAILATVLFTLAGSGAFPSQASNDVSQPNSITSSPLPISGVAAGFEHSCVLVNGGVKCWGSNRYGQLGNSLLTIHPLPIDVSGLPAAVIAITAGAYHTCALLTDATVWCWGLNSLGQLGNSTTNNSYSPVQVGGLTGIAAVVAGYGYTCVLTNTKTVECWGDNSDGQLGDGSTTDRSSPVSVSGLTNVSAIAAGFDHACALITGGTTVECWGKNVYGELGNGTITSSPTPVATSLPAGTTITAITAGSQHTCALTSTGTVLCWGEGSLGQIGNGTNNWQNATPQAVSSLTGVVAISAGGYADTGHTCALTSGGGIKCWGSNVLGQVGDGSNTDRNVPVAVNLPSASAKSVKVGVNHACAVFQDNTVWCWGSDSSGQLGDGIISISPVAIDVNGITNRVVLLGTGDRDTCVLDALGQTWCWGNNRDDQLGDGSQINRPAPTLVNGLTGAVTGIDGGMNQTCAIAGGGVKCWGNLDPTTNINNSPTQIGSLLSGVTSLSVTNLHGCAVANGAVRCWGDNSLGQLGDGTTTSSYLASVQVSGLASGVSQVTTGQWFSCALKTDKTVWCWGNNSSGQLGNDPAVHPTSSVPLQVSGLSSVMAIAAGQDHACALSQSGSVSCWGNNGQGQLGDGGKEATSFVPVQATGLTSGVSAITAGGYHTCSLVNGGVECWGFNSFGQLGNGQTSLSKVPVLAVGLTSGVGMVNAGGVNYDEEQSCAVNSQGHLKCWGGNKYGQLGDNLPILRNTPVHVLGLTNGPEIGVNYTTGKPGSYFRLTAANIQAGSSFSITINGNYVGKITASSEGYALFHVNANSTQATTLSITLSGSTSISTSIILAQNGPLHLQEGSGQVYYVNTEFTYLPTIMR